jgi:hypothetical protein
MSHLGAGSRRGAAAVFGAPVFPLAREISPVRVRLSVRRADEWKTALRHRRAGDVGASSAPGSLLDSGETPWKYCRVNLRLASGLALCAALGCLPASSDLSEYSAEWAEADEVIAGASSSSGSLAGAVAGGSSTSSNGAGAGGGQQVGGGSSNEGLGGAVFTPAATAGASSSEGGSAGTPPFAGTGGGQALPAPPEPLGPCSDGVLVAEQQRCYFVSTEAATWQGARLACVAWEGELVKVESVAEDQLLASLVVESIWLGASDTGVDNVYVWTDGSPVAFGNWGPGQPDAFAGSTDCIEKRAAEGSLWFDQPCDAAHLFICEKPLD